MATPPLKPVEPFLVESQALACIHCGLCLSSCPTYLETGNENDSPRGRVYLMRAWQSGRLPWEPSVTQHLDRCLGCRACEAACPSGVQYGSLLEATRDHLERQVSRPWKDWILRRIVIEQIFPYPRRLRLLLAPARWVRRFALERFLPRFAREGLALLPADLDQEDAEVPESIGSLPLRGGVGMISGCVMSVLFARTNAATVKLVRRAGREVVIPEGQGCCGALYSHGGNLARARDCARQNIEAFEKFEFETILINAAGCGSTLKEYGHLLQDDPAWAARAAAFSAKVKDLSEWLAQQPGLFPGAWAKVLAAQQMRGSEVGHPMEKVTYHDACHLAHAQGITRAPRDLLRQQPGIECVELPEAEVCCGSAGSYNLTEPELAGRLQRRKVENILQTGAKVVVTTNPGCLLQIQAGLRAAGVTDVRAVHLADYLLELNNSASRENKPCASG